MFSDFIIRWFGTWSELTVGSSVGLALVFVLTAFLPLPRSLLLVGAGAVYGLLPVFIIVPSSAIGSILAFLMARVLLRDSVQHQIDKRPLWKAVSNAVDTEGLRIVALMRFFGPSPTMQNYLFGLTNIELMPFSVITLTFSIPQIVLFLYLGLSGYSFLFEDGSSDLSRLLFLGAVVTVITIVILISRRVKMLLQLDSEIR